MLLSKTSWLSKICSSGFLFLLALILSVCSFFFYQADTWPKQILVLLVLAYLGFLLLKKYSFLVSFSLLVILIFAGRAYRDLQQKKLALPAIRAVKVYPDQVKIEDNWLSGRGHLNKGQILLTANLNQEQKTALKSGQAILLTNLDGEIDSVESPTNMGEFDYRKYYASEGIEQRLKLKSFSWRVPPRDCFSYFHYWRYCLQRFFAHMPRLLSFFSSELILAESPRSSDQKVLANYRDLGVIHLLSISGLHVGLYTFILSTLGYFLKRSKEEVFVLCSGFLCVSLLLAKNQAGFVRASLTYFLGQLLSLKKVPLTKADLLGLTALLHLMLRPRLFMNIGALMSYILVLGLQLTNHLPKFVQSCLLNLLLTPILLFNFYQVNLLTVCFNLLIVPYFNYFILPVTFLNLVLGEKFSGLSSLFEHCLQGGESIINNLAQSKIGLVTFGKINYWQCCLLLFLAAALLAFLNEQPEKKKVSYCLGQLLVILYLSFFLVIHFPVNGQVTFIDVGQGDSILFTTPWRRKVYLIDTGGKLNFTGKKIRPQIETKTLPLLKAQGINHIDGLFVTHQDADHVGDLGPLLTAMPVKKLYMAKGLINNPCFRKRITGRLAQTQLVELLAGMQVKDGMLAFQVLYPVHPGTGKNEDSLSLTTEIQHYRWLFTGDLNQAGEKKILLHYPNLKVDYFKLGHHGSRTASNPEFLRRIAPRAVFISAGRHNRFGHPHPETLATLKKLGLPWVSTQECGMISWYYNDFEQPKFKYFLKK